MAYRARLLAAAAVLPMSLIACDGDDKQLPPAGPHYHYIADHLYVPTSTNESREFGLDLDGDKTPNNQLGNVLNALADMGFNIQGTIDEAVAIGNIALLIDFQTEDFANTNAAGLNVFLAAPPAMPPACNQGEVYDQMAMTGCRHHLDGNGTFEIDAASPNNDALAGKIVNGTFNGGPGNMSLKLALGGTNALKIDLIGARAKASSISDSMIGTPTSGGAILGGAVLKEDIDNTIIPAIGNQLGPIITRDCMDLMAPPTCGCTAGTTGATIIDLFDTSDDCMVSAEEIRTQNLIVALLSPDVMIDGAPALSIGVKVTAVKATFTTPPI